MVVFAVAEAAEAADRVGEIDIACPAGHEPEFDAWRWEPIERLPALIIPFKRPVYEKVVEAFRHLAAPMEGENGPS